MSRPPLALVPGATAQPVPVAHNTEHSLSERIQRLQAEAQALAAEHVGQLTDAMLEVARIAKEVSGGFEAYPVGARELAGRIADDITAKAATLRAIAGRAGR